MFRFAANTDSYGAWCDRVLFSSPARGDGSRLSAISEMFSNASANFRNVPQRFRKYLECITNGSVNVQNT